MIRDAYWTATLEGWKGTPATAFKQEERAAVGGCDDAILSRVLNVHQVAARSVTRRFHEDLRSRVVTRSRRSVRIHQPSYALQDSLVGVDDLESYPSTDVESHREACGPVLAAGPPGTESVGRPPRETDLPSFSRRAGLGRRPHSWASHRRECTRAPRVGWSTGPLHVEE